MTSLSVLSVMGLLMCGTCAAQAFFPPWPAALAAWQSTASFKTASGLTLAVFLGLQWLLTFSRIVEGLKARNNFFLRWHVQLGLLAVPLLWLHACRYGYAHQTVLWWSYLATVSAGFCSPSLTGIRDRSYVFGWIIVHTALSLFVTGLAAYHAYVAFSYA